MKHNTSNENVNKASELMGKEPIAPIGMCFTAALDALSALSEKVAAGEAKDLALIHAIGVANMPGQEGKTIAHAWVEFTLVGGIHAGEKFAFEPIWGVIVPVEKMKESLKVSYSIRYTIKDIELLMFKDGRFDTGPWNKQIIELAEGARS
jgi:hypothetical protein